MNEKIKDKLTAIQVDNKMLVSTEVNGVKVSILQDIKDVDVKKVDRRLAILSANKDIVKIKAPKKIDKSVKISAFVDKAKGTENANRN